VLWNGTFVDAAHLAVLALAMGFLLHEVGLLALGHVAMLLVGAYAFGSVALGRMSEPAAVVFVAAASAALALTALRVRDDIFAIVGLAGAEGARYLAIGLPPLTGGSLGLGPFARSAWWSDGGSIIAPVAVLVAALLYWIVARSRLGLAFGAVRDSELLAEARGLRPGVWRFMAVAVTGVVAAGGGALQAGWFGFVSPDLGSLDVGLQAASAALLGAAFWRQGQPLRAISGILAGALMIAALPPLLRATLWGGADLAILRKALFGILLYAAVHPRSPLVQAVTRPV
jgi:branched-chain amino acid transport system permease protein